MKVYAVEHDPCADSWASAGRFHVVSIRETYERALEDVPETFRKDIAEGRQYYYIITEYDTEADPK